MIKKKKSFYIIYHFKQNYIPKLTFLNNVFEIKILYYSLLTYVNKDKSAINLI